MYMHTRMYVVVPPHSVDAIWKNFAAIYHVLFAYFFRFASVISISLGVLLPFITSFHFIFNITVNAYENHNAFQRWQSVELISFINAHVKHIPIRLRKKHKNDSIFAIRSECNVCTRIHKHTRTRMSRVYMLQRFYCTVAVCVFGAFFLYCYSVIFSYVRISFFFFSFTYFYCNQAWLLACSLFTALTRNCYSTIVSYYWMWFRQLLFFCGCHVAAG